MLQTKNLPLHAGPSLFALIDRGQFKLIEKNIEQFDLNKSNAQGEPPIFFALRKFAETQNTQYEELVELFIKNGANRFQTDADGNNALAAAVIHGSDALMQKFDNLGLDGLKQNHKGHHAVELWFDKHTLLKLNTPALSVLLKFILDKLEKFSSGR